MTAIEAYALQHGATVDDLEDAAEANGIIWSTTFGRYEKDGAELPVRRGSAVLVLLDQLVNAAINKKLPSAPESAHVTAH